jgi:hypothetical protein
MRPEQDIYSIDTEDTPNVYCINTEGGYEQQLADDYGLTGAVPVVQSKSGVSRREDRKWYRNPVPKERQSCELKVGADLLPALLVDESKGGFAVLIDCREELKCGKKASLHTDMGWFQVRIVYSKKTARPTHVSSKSDCWLRLGLRKARSFFLF